MGLRFRKSFKIAPGVKLNIGKKGAGVSVGTGGLHASVNSSGRSSVSAGIPGTGISYAKSFTRSRSQNSRSSSNHSASGFSASSPNPDKKPWYKRTGWIIALLIIFFPVGLFLVWKSDWSKKGKTIATACLAACLLFGSVGGNDEPVPDETTIAAESTTPADDISEPETTSTAENSLEAAESQSSAETTAAETSSTKESDVPETTAIETTVPETTTEKATTEEETTAEAQTTTAEETTAKKEATTEEETTAEENDGPLVWVSENGNRYHSRSGCSNMESPWQVTIPEAESMDRTPCGRCY